MSTIDFLTTKHPLLSGLNLSNPLQGSDFSASSDSTKFSDQGGMEPATGTKRVVLLNGIPYTMTDRKEETMDKVRKFYEDPSNLQRMLDVVEGRSKISLRLLDWLVTNYAKKYDIIYGIQKGDEFRQFMVYSSYRAQLRAYQKELFDPFCRHERIKFKYGKDGQFLRTTVGQLNFFRWAIENLVLDYAETHYDEITDDMKNRARSKTRHVDTINGNGDSDSGSASGSDNGRDSGSASGGSDSGGSDSGGSASGGSDSGGSASGGGDSGGSASRSDKEIAYSLKNGDLDRTIDTVNRAGVGARVGAAAASGAIVTKKNKKKELSISATKTISTHEVKILVKFD